MKKQNKKPNYSKKVILIIFFVVIITSLVVFVPWNSIFNKNNSEESKVVLTIETDSEITLYTGELYQIEYKATLNGKPYEKVGFEPTHKEILRVSDEGLIEALKPGITTVYISSGNKQKTISVTVTENPINSIYLSCIYNGKNLKNDDVISVGDTFKVTAKPSDENLSCDFIYESSDINIASVDENGLVTVHTNGKFTITAKVSNNHSVYASINLYGVVR